MNRPVSLRILRASLAAGVLLCNFTATGAELTIQRAQQDSAERPIGYGNEIRISTDDFSTCLVSDDQQGTYRLHGELTTAASERLRTEFSAEEIQTTKLTVRLGSRQLAFGTPYDTSWRTLVLGESLDLKSATDLAELLCQKLVLPVAFWKVTPQGIGAVQIGISIVDLVWELATCRMQMFSASDQKKQKGVLLIADCGSDVSVSCSIARDGTVRSVAVTGGKNETLEGIGTGDSLASALSAYGEVVGRIESPELECFELERLHRVSFCTTTKTRDKSDDDRMIVEIGVR